MADITGRARCIRQAIHALDDLAYEAATGFAMTDWGADNGCKKMLHHVRDATQELGVFLKAAQALDNEARKNATRNPLTQGVETHEPK